MVVSTLALNNKALKSQTAMNILMELRQCLLHTGQFLLGLLVIRAVRLGPWVRG